MKEALCVRRVLRKHLLFGWCFLCLLIGSVGLVNCGPGSTNPGDGGGQDSGGGRDVVVEKGPVDCTTIELKGEVKQDLTLPKACSPYSVDSTLSIVDGATLTVEAGVTIQFAQGWLYIGRSSRAGKLVAQGTAAEPIIFESSKPNAGPGSWEGLQFGVSTTEGSILEHVVVRHAGQTYKKACITIDKTPAGLLSLKNVTVEDCTTAGVWASPHPLKEFSGMKFKGMTFGMSLHPDVIGSIKEAFTYDGVERNQTHGNQLSMTATWVAQPVPWDVERTLEVGNKDNKPVLTLEAGVHLRFDQGWFYVGRSDRAGGLVAKGTAENPVIVESSKPNAAAGSWEGLYFSEPTLNGSVLEHVIVRHGGETFKKACITIDGTLKDYLSLKNVTIEDCTTAGVWASPNPLKEFSGMKFKGMPFGMSLHPDVIGSIKEAFTYDGVERNQNHGNQLSMTATWVAQPVPWDVERTLEVGNKDNKPVLTLEAGVHLRFSRGWFYVGRSDRAGGLIAKGTAEKPVIIESSKPNAAAGSWDGLYFSGPTLNDSLLEHVIVRHGGETYRKACITVEDTLKDYLSLKNVTIEDCAAAGLWVSPNPLKEIAGMKFKGSEFGMSMHPNAVGSIKEAFAYDGVMRNEIHGGNMTETSTWVAQPVPWDVKTTMEVGHATNNPVLTLEAGVHLRFASGWLYIGRSSRSGGLMAKGTSAKPIVFESSQPNAPAGSWDGLYFSGATLNGTSLDHVTVRHGGETYKKAGVTIEDAGDRVSIQNSTFSDNKEYDVWRDCKSNPTLQNNTYSSSGGLYTPTGC